LETGWEGQRARPRPRPANAALKFGQRHKGAAGQTTPAVGCQAAPQTPTPNRHTACPLPHSLPAATRLTHRHIACPPPRSSPAVHSLPTATQFANGIQIGNCHTACLFFLLIISFIIQAKWQLSVPFSTPACPLTPSAPSTILSTTPLGALQALPASRTLPTKPSTSRGTRDRCSPLSNDWQWQRQSCCKGDWTLSTNHFRPKHPAPQLRYTWKSELRIQDAVSLQDYPLFNVGNGIGKGKGKGKAPAIPTYPVTLLW
jgi:hypothetical protein